MTFQYICFGISPSTWTIAGKILNVSSGETKFAAGHLPSLFEHVRDLLMHASPAVMNAVWVSRVICFACLFQAPTCVNILHNSLRKQDGMFNLLISSPLLFPLVIYLATLMIIIFCQMCKIPQGPFGKDT